ncbi:right-handed parallel beta-helix repeat-containing protein [Luteimicrobium subarcticum]|uniref:Parallel beta helix pectate lyase-like protein n=1 Tax=Luteimicrobium subarcticum TaxID=620910 RepID=A0A2M8WJM1_9MICO|nr:right-handed parallel beta-helix repeat-containing protein [Luteimicrobium subarcticum]PJI91125.1 parallel beta helix pectate lyase-like protein [Luteimicrobium subarcticum]
MLRASTARRTVPTVVRTLSGAVLGAALLLGALAGCTSGSSPAPTPGASGTASTGGTGSTPGTIRVPQDATTIQGALDRAAPGDTVLVSPGTYEESVAVRTQDVVLRGTDRGGVVLDGGGLRPNGVVVTAPGVQVENLTVRDYTLNGVLVTGLTQDGGLARGSDGYTRLDPDRYPPLQGFAVRYVTASNNGLYGVYAFDAQHGVIEQSYASGSADSGFYVGQCRHCDIVVRDNVAELNAVGYEQTNASDSVTVVGNRFTSNRVGASLMSDYQEAFEPQHGTALVGNVVSDNHAAQTPAQADGAWGVGVAVSGGQDDEIRRNRVTGNPSVGIQIASAEDIPPDGVRVVGNRATGNGTDVAYLASARAPGAGLCAQGNVLRTTLPAGLLDDWSCTGGGSARAAGGTLERPDAPPGISFRDVQAPPTQPSMPDDAPTGARAPDVDVDAVRVPAADLLADRTHG